MKPATFLALTERYAHPAFLVTPRGLVLAANPAGATLLGVDTKLRAPSRDLTSLFVGPGEAWRQSLASWSGAGYPTTRPLQLRGADGLTRRYLAEGMRVNATEADGEVRVLLHCTALDPEGVDETAGRLKRSERGAPNGSERARDRLRGAPPLTRPPRSEGERGQARPDDPPRPVGKMEALGSLAGGVAHDFNNLLTVIRGEIELSLEHPDLPHDVAESLRSARAAVTRAETVIGGLLAFSRHQAIEITPVDLGELLAATAPELRALPGGAAVRVSPGSEPVPVRVAGHQVATVVRELVRNALEAIGPGGGVWLRARKEAIGPRFVRDNPGAVAGVYGAIEVRDDGHGIPPEVSDRMFEPFFSTRGPGRGLGLARAFGIVKAYGGYLRVESEVGVGSTLTAYLPLDASSVPGTSRPDA